MYCISSYPSLEALEVNFSATDAPKVLDFDTAMRRTLNQSLTLQQAHHDIQAQQGLKQQARAYPNPIFNYDLETSDKGWRSRQEIYALSQLVETAGKRQQRIQLATYEYYAALTGYEISKLDSLSRLSKAFIDVVAAQEFIEIAKNRQRHAQETLHVMQEKLDAGKSSSIQQHKAKIAASFAEINLKNAWAEFQTTKTRLALLWSSSCPDFDRVIYPFFDIVAPVPFEEYLSKLCDQPEIVQSLYQYLAASHVLRLEKAARIPNVSVTLGYSYNEGNQGVAAGISLPLPIWNQNQGNIKKAQHDLYKTGDQGQQLHLYLETKLSTTYLELVRAYQEAEELRQVVIKTSHQALELVQEGYQEGKFEYLDVLEMQKELFEMREGYLDALVNYHHKRIDLEYLNSQTE